MKHVFVYMKEASLSFYRIVNINSRKQLGLWKIVIQCEFRVKMMHSIFQLGLKKPTFRMHTSSKLPFFSFLISSLGFYSTSTTLQKASVNTK